MFNFFTKKLNKLFIFAKQAFIVKHFSQLTNKMLSYEKCLFTKI